MSKLKIRTRIMLWYTLLSVILLSIVLPCVYASVAGALRQTQDARLKLAVSQLAAAVELQDGVITVNEQDAEIEDGVLLALYKRDGVPFYTTPGADWLLDTYLPNKSGSISYRGQSWSYLFETIETNDLNITAVAVSAADYMDVSLERLIQLLLFIVPAYLAVSAVGAFILARRALRPIRQITQTAQLIGSGNLSNRIDDIEARDEVGELAETFNQMLDKLEISFKRERQFTSDASHELRTPITVIFAYSEDALTETIPDEVRESLEFIRSESRRMMKIISQLLFLSRGYEGRYHFEPDNITLHDMVSSVMDELKEAAAEKRICVHNEISITAEITADQSLMTLLFVNLIGNAIKYGKPGGNVWLRADCAGEYMRITVADDGIGISAEDQSHVFERFYRADKARDRSGSGLGLSIVKWIAELHHGSVKAESRMGGGSSFCVILPHERTP